MPATEQTWWNLKILHVAFAATAVALLVATVLMLTADHNRPWKKYAREFRDLETWTAAARVDEQDSKAYEQRRDELEAALADARRAPLDPAVAQAFLDQVRTVAEDRQAADLAASDVDQLATQQDAGERLVLRGDLLARLRDIVARAKFREDSRAGALKLRRAELDKSRADYELAVAGEAAADRQAAFLVVADRKRGEVADATLAFQDANTHRKKLEALLGRMSQGEDLAAKAVADHRAKLAQLQKTLEQRRPNAGKSLLELPVLDAFNSPLRIDQIWLPQLTLNNNFRDVARFDRCTTCHKGMDKSLPGAPSEPGYPEAQTISVALATPAQKPAAGTGDSNDALEQAYGLRLAARGLFDADDPTISVVVPESPAAVAGLQPGDVIEAVDGGRALARSAAVAALLDTASWGGQATLSVRRGVPQPYSSHPRLDLFVSDSSPHPMKDFGCTICHQGQGSATSFKWASHTPNTPKQAHEWHDEHGWFNNHHWIFPMLPKRFEQSSCLKCHHQVVDLEPSERFPEPPAPQLVEGYHLIRQYGCYGCHEINGWAGPEKRIGPDMRVEPTFHEAAEALAADPAVKDMGETFARWVADVRSGPDSRDSRIRLREAIDRDAAAGADARLSRRSHEMAVLLKDPETPGTLPKVGPSLRHVSSKLGFDWLYAWLRNPQEFRPSTKMPRFFGLWSHLDGKQLEESRRYEPLEIRSMVHYLTASSAPFEYVAPHEGITARADAARGRKVVQLRGCLACHQHDDFPDASSTHGPNLSRIGAKAASHPQGRQWLYSWLREPSRYHPKTIMPNVLLEPVPLADGTVSDPAADATEYLMGSGRDWEPAAEWMVETLGGEVPFTMASANAMTAEERAALDELALMYLKERFTVARAAEVLAKGLDAAANVQGDERMLTGLAGPDRDRQLLTYVGKKTINKLACYSCHDIPGFEDGKPAGAALADWGRKDPSRIAFEQVSHLVMHQMAHGHGGHAGHAGHAGHGAHESPAAHGDHGTDPGHDDDALSPKLAYELAEEGLHVDPESVDPDTGFFLEKLLGHEREGFLWQKLRAPRSYDYKKAENKTYNERYRMPQFPFDAKQREAVMTFVLGLVAEPPAPQYVHKPAPREQARLDGLVVAEQYNCGGCHQLRMDRWDLRYKPESLGPAPAFADYPFLSPHVTPDQVAASLATDRTGRRRATLVGTPVLDPETGKPQVVDEDGVPIEAGDTESVVHRPFTLWQDAVVDGQPRTVGGQNLLVPEDAVAAGRHYPGWGGDLARLLFPVVIADEKQVNPNVKPDDAWGWLPPPLVGEGGKVQSAWLHKFLLNPHPIRPPAVLRMPRFNFDSAKAAALVNYFAAVDGAEYPYVYDPRLDDASLADAERAHPGHLEGALKIVTNNNYCVKCHLVGDYTPAGSVKALAPQLQRVHERLRPDYVHGWIANPKRFLPYTGMPVNIPFNQPVSQDLYAGSSEQQVDALTDLLMHFDAFAKKNLSLEAFLRQQPAPAQPDQPGPAAQPLAPRRAAVPPNAAEPAPLSSARSSSAAGVLN
ncbi:MAG: PDZ domain-containing protein [Planctomycetaceae bacterium]